MFFPQKETKMAQELQDLPHGLRSDLLRKSKYEALKQTETFITL